MQIHRSVVPTFLNVFFICALLSCEQKVDEDVEKRSENEINETKTNSYSIFVEETKGCGWGYKIFRDGQMTINQEYIPAVQGNQCFSSQEDAQKVGDYVLDKIQKGAFPPTVSVEELDSLGVLPKL